MPSGELIVIIMNALVVLLEVIFHLSRKITLIYSILHLECTDEQYP